MLLHVKLVLSLQCRAPLLLEPTAPMSSAVRLELNTVDPGSCNTLVLESKSVNRQTEVLLDVGLLSWYTAGSGFLISVGRKELG